jgi:AraC-like DNA-binding protein
VIGAVLWQRKLDSAPVSTPIMPDGCMDLLWDGNCLFAAGPDTAARWHRGPVGTTYVALRFSGGLGPKLLGLPADELRDRTANLDELWPGRQVRVLTEQVAAEPAAVLEAWVVKRAARCDQDPLGPRVLAMAKAEMPVAVMAERLCISTRQLHRRCLPAFGYGPRHLSRIMRFQRALEEVRCGVPMVQVAATGGYADQAHFSREVRALAGTTPRGLLGYPYADGSGANRSTGRPSAKARLARCPPPVGGDHPGSKDRMVSSVSHASRIPPGSSTSTWGSASAVSGMSIPNRR